MFDIMFLIREILLVKKNLKKKEKIMKRLGIEDNEIEEQKYDAVIDNNYESYLETIEEIEEPSKDAKNSSLESDLSTGEGLKIMTPNQLLTRLPILLAQKKAGNNSQKLNNEIRQIIYSLYQSKNMSKTVYNRFFIDFIKDGYDIY